MPYLITTSVHYTKTYKSKSIENSHVQMINVAELVIMKQVQPYRKLNLLHFIKASTLSIIHSKFERKILEVMKIYKPSQRTIFLRIMTSKFVI